MSEKPSYTYSFLLTCGVFRGYSERQLTLGAASFAPQAHDRGFLFCSGDRVRCLVLHDSYILVLIKVFVFLTGLGFCV